MANIYYGDGLTAVVDGNWNHAANWYLTVGSDVCCIPTGGTPAGRVPQAGDSVVLYGGAVGSATEITTGPANWAGPLSWALGATVPTMALNDAGATYSGSVTVSGNSAVIKQGKFPGAVALRTGGTISGGNFTGSVTRTVTAGVPQGSITGGTYEPTASCSLGVGNLLNTGSLPVDPGFAVSGATYAPIITVTGITAAAALVLPAMNVGQGAGNISPGRYSPPFPAP